MVESELICVSSELALRQGFQGKQIILEVKKTL